MAAENVIELLLKSGVLDERQRENLFSRAKGGVTGGHIVQEIAEMGYATESTVARAMSVELGLPRIDLHATPPELDAVSLLDARTCIEKFVLPVALREGGELLWLAMGDPTDSGTMASVRRATGRRVRPVVGGPTEIVREARRLYSSPLASANELEFDRDGGSIEVGIEGEDLFEVVNIADESAAPPGAPAVPPLAFSSQPGMLDAAGLKEALLDAAATAQRELEELFHVPQRPGGAPRGDLSPQDLVSLDAVRGSMEKGALVLRALAELCVDKGLFTREEMGKKGHAGG